MKKKMAVKPRKTRVDRLKDIPATAGMLHAVRDDLKSELSSFRYEMKAILKDMDSRLHQSQLMMEEQNNRSLYVYEHLEMLFDRQERSEGRIDAMEELLARFSSYKT